MVIDQRIVPPFVCGAPFYPRSRRLDGKSRIADDRSMRLFVLSCLAAFGAFVAAGPARADFAECVASLRAEASRAGISAKTLDAAFNGLQPDMKVLDLQQRQPEFKTPVWDYVDGLVEAERVADGKAATARASRAPARA